MNASVELMLHDNCSPKSISCDAHLFYLSLGLLFLEDSSSMLVCWFLILTMGAFSQNPRAYGVLVRFSENQAHDFSILKLLKAM